MKHRLPVRVAGSLSVVTVGALFCAAASAQTEAAPGATADSGALEEVVVTAERRPESLENLPISGQALSGDQLAARGVKDFSDLQFQAPATTVQTNGLTTFFNIRGVGLNASSPSVTAGVAKLLDGAFIVGTGLALGNPFYDLDHVEILRGPQGTFVGQESTGGAVFVVTRDPDLNNFGVDVSQSIGNYSDVQTEGALNLPVSSRYGFRLAFDIENRDSFFKNFGTSGAEPGNLNSDDVRLKFLAEPTDDLKITLSYEKHWLRSDGAAFTPTSANGAYYVNPYSNPNGKGYPYILGYDDPTLDDTTTGIGIAKIEWTVPDLMLIRSLTSLQTLSVQQLEDVDATTSKLFEATQSLIVGPNTVWTEEVDLVSQAPGPLQWTAGLFFDHQKQSNDIVPDNIGAAAGGPLKISIANPVGYTQSGGVFGQASWDVTSNFQLTAGLRENEDRATTPQGTTTISNGFFTAVTNSGFLTSGNEKKTTGKLAFDWKLTDDDHLYGTASRGSKAGGYNSGGTILDTLGYRLFKPETVDNYELGWKTEQLDHHLRADVDAFYMNYKDYQLSVYVPQTGTANPVINLPKSVVKGFESQLEFVADGFTGNLTGAYVDSYINQNSYLIDARTLPFGGNNLASNFNYAPYYQDVDGNVLPYAPKWTVSAGLQYAFHLAGGSLTPRVQWAYLASQRGSLYNPTAVVPGGVDQYANGDYIPSHATLDARLTYAWDSNWSLALYGTNLTNQAYIVGLTQNNALYGAPRQYGVQLEYHY